MDPQDLILLTEAERDAKAAAGTCNVSFGCDRNRAPREHRPNGKLKPGSAPETCNELTDPSRPESWPDNPKHTSKNSWRWEQHVLKLRGEAARAADAARDVEDRAVTPELAFDAAATGAGRTGAAVVRALRTALDDIPGLIDRLEAVADPKNAAAAIEAARRDFKAKLDAETTAKHAAEQTARNEAGKARLANGAASEMEEQLESAQTLLHRANSARQEAESEASRVGGELRQATERADEIAAQLDNEKETTQRLSEQKQELADQLAAETQAREEVAAQLRNTQTDLVAQRARLSDREQQLSEARTELAAARTSEAGAVASAKNAQAERKRVETERDEALARREKAIATAAAEHQRANDAVTAKDRAETQLEALRSEIEQLRASLTARSAGPDTPNAR